MNIDINNGELTLENVKRLIASKDDSKARQIRVTVKGIVFLSDDVGAQNLEGILFRLPTYGADNKYVGKVAADDASHVASIYDVLRNNWPNPISQYIDNV